MDIYTTAEVPQYNLTFIGTKHQQDIRDHPEVAASLDSVLANTEILYTEGSKDMVAFALDNNPHSFEKYALDAMGDKPIVYLEDNVDFAESFSHLLRKDMYYFYDLCGSFIMQELTQQDSLNYESVRSHVNAGYILLHAAEQPTSLDSEVETEKFMKALNLLWSERETLFALGNSFAKYQGAIRDSLIIGPRLLEAVKGSNKKSAFLGGAQHLMFARLYVVSNGEATNDWLWHDALSSLPPEQQAIAHVLENDIFPQQN